jgi:hypothetical protein
VAHLRTNGQVERANIMILEDLKPWVFTRLNQLDRRWLQELSTVLWSLRTTPTYAIEYMPYFMAYRPKLSSLLTSSMVPQG